MKTSNITVGIYTIITALFCTNSNAGTGMGMDSTDIIQGNMNIILPKINIATAGIKSSSEFCSAYAGSYGISAGSNIGKVILNYENDATKPNYGQIVYVNSSGCSIPSQPVTVTRQCSSFIGSYGIASGSIGTFTLTTEGNSYKSNYGAVLSTDTSGCYASQPPGCYGTSIQTWAENGKQCAGQPPNFTVPLGITSANSNPGLMGATGTGVMYFYCRSVGGGNYQRDPLFTQSQVNQFGGALSTCN